MCWNPLTISLVIICENHLETWGKGNITRLFHYKIPQIKSPWKRRKDHSLKIWQFAYLARFYQLNICVILGKSLDSFKLNSSKLSEGVVHVLHIILFQKISKASATDLRNQSLLNEWNMNHYLLYARQIVRCKVHCLKQQGGKTPTKFLKGEIGFSCWQSDS